MSFQMFWYQRLWVYMPVTFKIMDCNRLHVFYYQFLFDLWTLILSLWLTLFVLDRVGWSTSSSRGAPPMMREWQKPATSMASSWFTQRHGCSTTKRREGYTMSNCYMDKWRDQFYISVVLEHIRVICWTWLFLDTIVFSALISTIARWFKKKCLHW